MADTPPLDAADYSGLEAFYTDFSTILKGCHELDRYYQLGKQEADHALPKMRKALAAFNKKYKDLSLTIRRKPSSLELLIMLKDESDMQTFFARSASRIKGISSLGLQSFDEVSVSETEKVEKLIQRMKTRLFMSYADPEVGTTSFMAQKKGKVILLTCNWKDLLIRTTPEFKLCSYYALRHPFQRKINVLNYAAVLGFTHSVGLENVDLQDSFEPYSRAH
jgi:hypothetical protein